MSNGTGLFIAHGGSHVTRMNMYMHSDHMLDHAAALPMSHKLQGLLEDETLQLATCQAASAAEQAGIRLQVRVGQNMQHMHMQHMHMLQHIYWVVS